MSKALRTYLAKVKQSPTLLPDLLLVVIPMDRA
uniref:Uncharacterized protein n=1 Tax=Utricularia reniformis TaxID=192314 RepID=A0A1Y0B4J1_9LAMI|nr:hypothetical protein AEK19_MT2161 [Utricularia reniformis]ART32310.1 hypothetical protein AEK19_MT2161 [Utricularia reniformis]